ncbi:MAG: response regulator [Lachnospiraceae bacterium]|nr:response regulator [Lachnospiraceae bacterium]
MNKQVITDQSPIEYILSVLYGLEHGSDQRESPSLSIDADLKTALELKKFVDEIPGGFFIYHADGGEELLYANKAMLRLFACDTLKEFQELTGNTFPGLVHPDDLESVECSIREQIRNSQYDLDYVEYRIIRKDGQIRWVEDYGHFLHSQFAGDIFYVFVADATEKREMQSEEELRRLAVIEGLSSEYEAILYVDLDKDRLLPYRLSSRIEFQFHSGPNCYSFHEFCTKYVSTWVYPEDQALITLALDPHWIRKNVASQNTYYVNYRIQTPESIQCFQLRIAHAGHQESCSQVVIGSRRVDDEIQHEMEQKKLLEDTLNHAKRANIAKNTFLANMSHDMRTPLNAITGFTALAKNHMNEPEKLAEYLQKIRTSGDQLLSLINDILEISRIESGTLQTEDVPCCLSDLISDFLKSLAPRTEKKRLSLTMDLSDVEHACVYSDPGKLKQILSCLTSNAIKYTSEGGHIKIAVSERKAPTNNYASYEFSVEDNGIGIAQEYLEHIFEPFERVKSTTFSGIHGTGLGLTIARRLVELMDGTITVESTPERGSRFAFFLTLRIQSSNALEKEDAAEALLRRLKGRKILLVDDNDLNLELESELLEDLGFLVDTAMDGRIALDLLLQADPGTYALILMDIQMPIMNGYETTQVIRSLNDPLLHSIPIIALSANAFEEDRRMSRKSGMNAHLSKPLNTDQLLEFLAEII